MTATALYNNMPAGFWVPNGVIDTVLLDKNEKLAYIAIRRHVNSKSKTAWPGLRRLARETRLAVNTVQGALDGLEDKGILQVSRTNGENGEHKVNVYRFCDTAETWEAETVEDMRKAAYKQPETVEDVWSQAVDLLKMLNVPQAVIDTVYQYSTASKEKGLPEMAVSESPENHMYSKNYNLQEQNTAEQPGIQADSEETEKFSVSELKEAVGYDIEAVPEADQFLYDTAVLALSDALKGPTRAVDRQGLELLRHDDLLEAVGRLKGQKGVKNPRRYLKQVLLNMVQEKKLEAQKPIRGKSKSPAGTFKNFTEREYDFAELERKLLLSQDDYNS